MKKIFNKKLMLNEELNHAVGGLDDIDVIGISGGSLREPKPTPPIQFAVSNENGVRAAYENAGQIIDFHCGGGFKKEQVAESRLVTTKLLAG